MLRAVLIGDRETFDRTFAWAENNLNRKNEAGETTDRLWAWKWGKNSRGEWGTIDPNFASDADIDAATALILAARRWHNPDYVDQARSKLKDLWALSIVSAADQTPYLLPGPKSVFQPQPNQLILNPSYLAPYAFRLFAQVDNELNWMRLVDSSYQTIEQSATISEVGLPSDWVMLDLQKGEFHPVTTASQLQSRYGFDAYRVWWRVALDAIWFQEPKALAYLENHLTHLQQEWRNQQKLPAQISLQGKPMVDYEATAQYAMLYPALQRVDSTMADQIYQQKLLPAYKNGFWDNNSAYYTQNLAWFALLPATPPAQIDRTASTGRSNCFQFMSRLNR
jgi:endoglucanase